jgi:hypothetical protein
MTHLKRPSLVYMYGYVVFQLENVFVVKVGFFNTLLFTESIQIAELKKLHQLR